MNYYETIDSIFKKYIGNKYDIALYEHTLRVASNSSKIADSLLLSTQDKKLAYLIAILHELGKFKNEDTINLLFEEQVIRLFSEEAIYDDVIRDIIYSYDNTIFSDYFSETAKLQFKILNDSDKLDQLYLDSLSLNLEGIPGSKINGNLLNSFSNDQEGSKQFVHSPLDSIIYKISYVFSFHFKYSYYLVEQEKYIEKIIINLTLTDPNMINLFEQLKTIVAKYITEKIGETYRGW